MKINNATEQPVDQSDAERLGLFEEDALTEQQAIESREGLDESGTVV
jgi:hypothetical protein